MGRQANSIERELASMSSCPQCGLQLPEGSSFCNQCGTRVREEEPVVPRLEADGEPPQFGLAGAEKIPRFTPHAADEPTCRFCRGPLDLSGEFCEQCGAPVSEAVPSRRLKPAAAASPIVSKEISPPAPSPTSLPAPPAAQATPSPATLSCAPSPIVPPRLEEKALRTQPLNIAPPPRSDQPSSPGWTPGQPATTLPASPPAPALTPSSHTFAPEALPFEPSKLTFGRLAKTVVAPLPQTSAPRPITGPSPGAIPAVSVPARGPVRGEEAFPAQPKTVFPLAVPSAASHPEPPAAKAASPSVTLPYAPSPLVPHRPVEKALRTEPRVLAPPPPAHPPSPPGGRPGAPSAGLPASPPAPAQNPSRQEFAPKAPAAEPPPVTLGQLPQTGVAPLPQPAAPRPIFEPSPATIPTVSVPLIMPVRSEEVIPGQPKKPFPWVLVVGIAGSLLAVGMIVGWHLFHRGGQSPPVGNVTAPQINSPAPSAAIAAPTLAPLDTSPPASDLPKAGLPAPAPSRKSHRAKAVLAANPVPAAPATDHHAAEIVRLQNLALEACSQGRYAEPQATNAIAYSQQALALDPSNDYTRRILENSIKGGEYQVQQAILGKDFTTAHRITDVLAQLLPGESTVAGLKADLAKAEKAEEESRRAGQAPAPILSFRVAHLHSGRAAGDKGSYCAGTLKVVAGRLKYVGETATDGQVHNFDFACSEVEIKKNSRVAFWEKGFHVRTASGNITFVPEDGSASHLRALASACAK